MRSTNADGRQGGGVVGRVGDLDLPERRHGRPFQLGGSAARHQLAVRVNVHDGASLAGHGGREMVGERMGLVGVRPVGVGLRLWGVSCRRGGLSRVRDLLLIVVVAAFIGGVGVLAVLGTMRAPPWPGELARALEDIVALAVDVWAAGCWPPRENARFDRRG